MVGGDDRTLPCAITRARTAQRRPTTPRCATTPRSCAPTSWRCRKSMGRRPRRRCSRATTSASARARTRRRTASRSAAACRIAASREYEPLSLDNAVRRGVVVTFFPGTGQRIPADVRAPQVGLPGRSADRAEGRNCDLLSRQVAPLEAWIEGEAQRRPSIRRARRFQSPVHASRRARRAMPQGRPLNVYAEIDDGDPPAAKLTNITGAREIHALHHATANTASTSTTSCWDAISRRAC